MKKTLFITLVITLYSAQGATQTTEKVCDPQDPTSCLQTVFTGQQVPFNGVLMTNKRAAKLLVLAEGCQDRLNLSLAEAKEIAAAQLKSTEDRLKNSEDTFKIQKDILLKRLEESEEIYSPKWYEKPIFVVPVTAIVTVGLLAMSVKTLQVLK